MPRKVRQLSAVLVASVALAALAFLIPRPEKDPPKSDGLRWFDRQVFVFHGIPARTFFALPDDTESEARAQQIFAEIQKIYDQTDRIFNAFSPDSELGKINALNAAGKVSVSSELSEVIEIAKEIWSNGEGAFDPTVWPLKKLWSMAEKRQSPPSEDEIKAALLLIGMDKIRFSKETRELELRAPGQSLDFGGLAKGWVVDRTADLLKNLGISNGLVICGGEIRSFGHNPDSKPWNIGVQHPLKEGELSGTIMVSSEISLSTSGNYRQPIQIGEVTYYHIFNPKTGKPIATDVLGVTVLLTQGVMPNSHADAWTKVLAVLGPEKGLAIAKKNGFDALFLMKSLQEGAEPEAIMTDGFRRVYTPSGI